jgi:hypothetical protein
MLAEETSSRRDNPRSSIASSSEAEIEMFERETLRSAVFAADIEERRIGHVRRHRIDGVELLFSRFIRS